MPRLFTFDVLAFYRDYSVPYLTSGHKHTRPGWVQTHCPFCVGSQNWHLGCHQASASWVCWRCGKKDRLRVIGRFARVGNDDALKLLGKYRGEPIRIRQPKRRKKPILNAHTKHCPLPTGAGSIGEAHCVYLEDRGFDPDEIEHVYKIKGTGAVGHVDYTDDDGTRHRSPFRFRIIIPVYMNGVRVSYTARDITNTSNTKYRSAPAAVEVRDIKTCLYALDLAKRDAVIVTEGAMDAWKLGPGAVAVMGVSYLPAQVRLLERFRKVFVLFDDDAYDMAADFARDCSLMGNDVEIVDISDEAHDAGELTMERGREITRTLIG